MNFNLTAPVVLRGYLKRGRLVAARAICLVFWLFAAQSSVGAQYEPFAGGVKYRVDIIGAPKAADDLLKESSQLLLLKDRLPPSLAALGRRAVDDEGRFRAVLESEGYYDAKVMAAVDGDGSGDVTVRMTIEPGARFRVAGIALEIEALETSSTSHNAAEAAARRPLNKITGRVARAPDVIAAEDEALSIFRNRGFPFTTRGDRLVEIDHAAHTISVTLPVTLGPAAVFGETHFLGLERVKERFMARSVPWKAGATFDMSLLEELRKSLVDLTLFASVKVVPVGAKDMASGGPLDVNVVVTESAPRTISLGGSYARDKGFGGTASWNHRNFFGSGEQLELSLEATQLDQTAKAVLSKPNFLRRNQTLKTAIESKHAGQKRAERHGNADGVHQKRGPADNQQCCGCKKLRRARCGDGMQDRSQKEVSANNHLSAAEAKDGAAERP